jgi:hypothetical protein
VLGRNTPIVVVTKEVTIIIRLPGGIVIAVGHSSNFVLGSWGLRAVLVNPLFLGCCELHVFLCGVVFVGLKPSDLVNLSLVWGSAFAWASATAPAAMSMSATTSSSGVTAPATAMPTAAKLGNTAHVGRVLFMVTDEVSKQRQTCPEGLFFFPHGQHLADHGLDRIVLDSSQQMADLGALVKATVAVLHQVLGNGVLLDMGISLLGPIPILLLAMIGQAHKVGFHLVGKMIHMITSKIMGKPEMIQLADVLLLLGRGGMKPHGHLVSNKMFHTVTILMRKVSQNGPFSSSSAMTVTDWPEKATLSLRIGVRAIALASKDR